MHNKSKLDKNFIKTIKIFNKNKINYWLCHGTLLGIIRDKQLIPWDHDIDLAVWKKKKLRTKILSVMKKNKFVLKKKFLIKQDLLTFIYPGGREVDINFYDIKGNKKNKIAFVKWFVPRDIFCKFVDALSSASNYRGKLKQVINSLKFTSIFFRKLKFFMIKKKLFYRTMGYTHPLSLVNKFKKIKFKGLELVVPKEPNKYLNCLYGDNWKVANKDFNWIKDSPATKEL